MRVTEAGLTEAELKECRDFSIFGGVFIALFVVVGMIGNTMTVLVFRKASNRTSTMYLISNLAIVDGLVTLIFSPAILPATFHSLGNIYITYVSNLAFTLNQISIFFIALLVWQRYISMCKPHSAQKWTKISTLRIMAISAVALSIVAYFPGFFKFTLTKLPNGEYKAISTPLGSNMLFYYLHTVVVINLISYLLPMIVIAFATIRLMQSLRQQSTSMSSQQAKRQLTLSVVVIVMLFTFLQVFRPIRYILIWVYHPYTEAVGCQGPLMHYGQITPFATILNSSVNFIIYVLCAKGFRKKVFDIICRSSSVEPAPGTSGGTLDDK